MKQTTSRARYSRRAARSAIAGVLVLAAIVVCTATRATSQVPSNPRVVTDEVAIRQDELLQGRYMLARVLAAGGQFFTNPYMPEDGVGEGAAGPRSLQRKALYPHHPLPFLRLNGIDSQSCYECHNDIGEFAQADGMPGRTRKPGSVGGSAGFASELFQNPAFPDPITMFLRNPPHVFGTGYSQQIAWEMTQELYLQKTILEILAFLHPDTPQSRELTAKGLAFGTLTVTFESASGAFDTDTSGVTGVDEDLIVRPFQNKGIASSVRHFVMSALDFHFSMQAIEAVGIDHDCDEDGRINEMAVELGDKTAKFDSPIAQQSLGNVAALSTFVAMTRPPQQTVPAGQEKQVAAGLQAFKQVGCAECHRTSMQVEIPYLTVAAVSEGQLPTACPTEADDQPTPQGVRTRGRIPKLGSGAFADPEDHPAVRGLYVRLSIDPDADPAARARSLADRLSEGAGALGADELLRSLEDLAVSAPYDADTGAAPSWLPKGYHVDLTNPDTTGMSEYLVSYITPRLPASADGSIEVPLFSDLRLHDMGEGLSDVAAQETDVSGVYTPARFFLTRPLWGVGDTPPYLHDGRAHNLADAIRMHSSSGSEANDAVAAFDALPAERQEAVFAFLRSLRLPVQTIYD